MPQFTDQTGRSVTIDSDPKRIISLVPSQTELLHYFGLDEEVIGITKFCVHPNEWFRTKTRVGGTKQLNIDLIRSLQPDLIIGNKEENVKEQINLLEKEFPVWLSDVNSLDDAIWMIKETGKITGCENKANELSDAILVAFKKIIPPSTRKKCIYLIWDKPMMVAGSKTFIDSMITVAGLDNAMGHKSRYPEITRDDIIKIHPDLIILSSEPYPFTKHQQETFSLEFPFAKVELADGEMFSWYGSRMLNAARYFQDIARQW